MIRILRILYMLWYIGGIALAVLAAVDALFRLVVSKHLIDIPKIIGRSLLRNLLILIWPLAILSPIGRGYLCSFLKHTQET